MKFRKRDTRGGLLKDPVFHAVASVGQMPGERLDVLPLEISGKQYAIALYFPKSGYWRRTIKNLPIYMLSFIFPRFYMRAAPYGDILQGIKVMDISPKTVPYDRTLYNTAFQLSKAWIEVYLIPFFDPKMLRAYDLRLKVLRRLVQQSKTRKYPASNNQWEQVYFERLKVADSQAIAELGTMERQNRVVHNLVGSFRQVSDHPPTDRGLYRARDAAVKLKESFQEMSDWCEKRANTWPDFVDAHTICRINQEEKKSQLNRLGWRVILDAVPGILVAVLTSIPVGIAIGVVRDVGTKYILDLVLRPKWQAKQLREASDDYLRSSERAQKFLDIFSAKLTRPFIRA